MGSDPSDRALIPHPLPVDMKKRKLKKLLKEATEALKAQGSPEPAGLTVSQWLPSYERLLGERGYCAQTMRNHRACLGHVRRVWGEQYLRAMKPHNVSTGVRALAVESSHTAKRVLACLEDVFAEAIENEEAEHNPAKVVRKPKHHTMRGRLSLEVWRQMLDASKLHRQRWVRAMLLLAIVTGQRRADLAKMRFDDIVTDDQGRQVLRVEQQKKAGKPRGARIALPLTLRLECVGMSLADVIELCKTIGKPGDTLLRKANGAPIEMSSLSTRFHELIVAELGQGAYELRKWPSLHEVRSLSARTYKAEGLADRQGLLGHANAAMTTIYEDARDLADDSTWRVVCT